MIVGDDFPLGVVMIDLNFPDEYEKRGNQEVLYCGLCKSGLTIKDATESILKSKKDDRTIIVYLGSVDIIQGRNLTDLKKDFNDFIQACRVKHFYPTLCTLAPIPTHQLGTRKATLLEFNKHLEAVAREFQLPVIDTHKAFLKPNGSFEEYCYAVAPRGVSGMKDWIAPWSILGRQRFLEMIKKNIGNAFVADGFVKLDKM